jgi:3,4-dihydroxy 2-butanone 4-phosphate synthase/GTP cyclohydrolase II
MIDHLPEAEAPARRIPDSVEAAIEEIRRGGIALVVDDESRENEGDLIMAADAASTETTAFFLRHTSGVICASLCDERADVLALPLMVVENQESQGSAFTVTVDLAGGVRTGISAADRAATIRGLADPRLGASAIVCPGHVFPLRARTGGVLRRAGHTEAAADLARLAGREPAGVLCEVVSEDKASMARGPERRERVPIARRVTAENRRSLRTRRERMGQVIA